MTSITRALSFLATPDSSAVLPISGEPSGTSTSVRNWRCREPAMMPEKVSRLGRMRSPKVQR